MCTCVEREIAGSSSYEVGWVIVQTLFGLLVERHSRYCSRICQWI